MSIGSRSKYKPAKLFLVSLSALAVCAGGFALYASGSRPTGAPSAIGELETDLEPVEFADGKWGFAYPSGAVAITGPYDGAGSFVDGLAAVKLDGKWGFIDTSGRLVVTPQFEEFPRFSDGRLLIESHGRYGFIDRTGAIAIPLTYEGADNFSDGLAKIKLNGKVGFIDPDGTLVLPAKYDDSWGFHNGVANFERNGKWGYIDKTGKELIPPRYYLAGQLGDDGTAVVYMNMNDAECFEIDMSGRTIRNVGDRCPEGGE